MSKRERVSIVFFFVSCGTFAGSQQQIYQLVKGINKERFRPILVGTDGADPLLRKASSLEEVETRSIPLPKLLDLREKRILKVNIVKKCLVLLSLIHFNRTLAASLRGTNPHIFWFGNLRALLTGFRAAKALGAVRLWRLLLTENEGWFRVLNRLGWLLSDRIITEYSKASAEVFGPRLSKSPKITYLHPGFDFPDPSKVSEADLAAFGIPSGVPVVGNVAVLVPRKGHDYFLEMARIVSRARPEAKFAIVGDTPAGMDHQYREGLVAKSKDLGIKQDMAFLGWSDELPDVLRRMDVFAFPSLKEGLPGVVPLAMAAGKPVVSFDVGGVSDAIESGKTGYVVAAKDVNAMAARVVELLENPVKAKKMGQAAQERVRAMFSRSAYIQRCEQEFADLMRV